MSQERPLSDPLESAEDVVRAGDGGMDGSGGRQAAGDAPRRRGSARAGLILALGAIVVSGAFVAESRVRGEGPTSEFFRTPTPHEAHFLSIRERGLDGTEMGSRWISEADRALTEPIDVRSPYAEEGRFTHSDADAVGYRVRVERGQRLEIALGGGLVESGELLVDVFRAAPDPTARPARIRSPRGAVESLVLEPREDAEYILRIQPTLFSQGSYRLSLRAVPAYLFPVAGRDNSHVWSAFGVEREGGRRQHNGIDIFADRGTPVLAVADARVRRVDETPVGGKVVWLRDELRGFSVYYAHLDSQVVRTGDRVQLGDTLGFVGNTGNARTTPPHLHFGIYNRGPRDPFPYVRMIPTRLPDVGVDVALTGSVANARVSDARLRTRPSTRGDVVQELERGSPFRVVAAADGWYRVRLPDGTEGFVDEDVVEDPGLGRIALEVVPSPETRSE